MADANGSLLNVPATLRGLDEDHGWFIKYTDAQRAQAAGFAPDGAHRERVVSPDGTTAREVRLVVAIEGR